MRRILAAAAFVMCASAARAQTIPACPLTSANITIGGCGASVPTGTPSQVINPAGSTPPGQYVFESVTNVGPAGSGVAWCSHYGAPGKNLPGSFPVAPMGNGVGLPWIREFNFRGGAGIVPQQALLCVSDGGTNGSTAASLTVETR